jgi:DtxR family Mn-dependent transcriptional regulator
MPTTSVENYLKAMYHLQSSGERVKTKALADALEVSHASVTSMMQSLAGENLVEYRRYKGAVLTTEGRATALNVIRKHRLIEMFLVETLDYTWDQVHHEAENLEHSVSDELAQRIDDYLGNPQFDPHGDPIPTADGEIVHRESHPLNESMEGDRVLFTRVLDQNPELLRKLSGLGLAPGIALEVLEVQPYDGLMSIEIDGDSEPKTISRLVATRLLVMEAHDEEDE